MVGSSTMQSQPTAHVCLWGGCPGRLAFHLFQFPPSYVCVRATFCVFARFFGGSQDKILCSL